MKLIVGLGNPGLEYALTYHNLGFLCLDRLSQKLCVSFNKAKFNSVYGQTKCGGEIVFLVKPLTYMNLSGTAVKEFMDYYKISADNVVVVCDDIDLPKGVFRYRERGSAGTHRGLRDIVERILTEEFRRVRIGAGQDENEARVDLKDYVVSKINDESFDAISSAVDDAVCKILELINGQTDKKD